MKETVLRMSGSGDLLVGIGPMSANCTETIYRYSHDHARPMELIASRRQVECAALGRGYVHNWTTEEFGRFCAGMKEKHPKAEVFVCRDHGGPWQGDNEALLPRGEAMERAVASYRADIDAGFSLLHIDPSLCKDGNVSIKAVIENTLDLLGQCEEYARSRGRQIEYEIGTEENSGSITTHESFVRLVQSISAICARDGMHKPLFVVGQTSSLVKEMRQVGEFNEKNTAALIEAARQHGFLLKEHNADYLSAYQLWQRRKVGVPSMNVAPEFGVAESRVFVDYAMECGGQEMVKKFVQLAVSSGKWKKWVLNPDLISDYDKAVICGHYVFARPEFADLRKQLDEKELDRRICAALYERIGFYQNAGKAKNAPARRE